MSLDNGICFAHFLKLAIKRFKYLSIIKEKQKNGYLSQ